MTFALELPGIEALRLGAERGARARRGRPLGRARRARGLASAAEWFGTTELIGHRSLVVPGGIETVDFRAQDPGGAYGGGLLAVGQGRYDDLGYLSDVPSSTSPSRSSACHWPPPPPAGSSPAASRPPSPEPSSTDEAGHLLRANDLMSPIDGNEPRTRHVRSTARAAGSNRPPGRRSANPYWLAQ